MRADVNLSVREAGSQILGTRTEMKNLNSFKAIARAIEGERARQIELLEEGKEVIQETRRWMTTRSILIHAFQGGMPTITAISRIRIWFQWKSATPGWRKSVPGSRSCARKTGTV